MLIVKADGDGRFREAVGKLFGGRIRVILTGVDGEPWLMHPSWGSREDTPAVLHLQTRAFLERPELVDRAADLRSQAYWRAEHPERRPEHFEQYLAWSKQQRARLHQATLIWES